LSATAPGRFLMPGDLEGSPALTFAPLPGTGGRGSLWAAFERRFEAYKRHVVLPFFRNHFARIDRQIVLTDVLGALEAGPQAVADLSQAMSEVLTSFKTGRNGWLAPLTGRKVDRILFAATKADYLHHSQHEAFAAIASALVKEAREKAEFSGARTAALALASLRATVEDRHGGTPVVRGTLAATGKSAALHPGELPADPAEVLRPPPGQGSWLHEGYARALFRPPSLARSGADGLPHIRLDRALQFLIGDRL
jgi:predicted YcjX-like family ATPase